MKKKITLCVALVMMMLTTTAQVSNFVMPSNGKLKKVKSTIIDESKVYNGSMTRAGVEFPWLETFETSSPTSKEWTYQQTLGSEFDMEIGSISSLDAISGIAYMASGYNASRSMNSWAFSPAISLTAGTTYYIGVYLFTPGYYSDIDEVRITVGTGANEAAQSTVIIDKSGSKAEQLSEFTLQNGTFTPSVTGTYYFGLHHCTQTLDVNAVAFEDFTVQTEPIKNLPTINSLNISETLWDIKSSIPLAYVSKEVGLKHEASQTGATSSYWSVNNGATVDSPTDDKTAINYPASGKYTATYTATNSDGNKEATMSYEVDLLDTKKTALVTSIIPSANLVSNLLWSDDNTPVFGLCNNYKEFGEIFTFPGTAKITSLSFYVNDYAMGAAQSVTPLKFTFYPMKDGSLLLADTKVYTTTISDAFGAPFTTEKDKMIEVNLPEAINVVNDSVFITMTFDESLVASSSCVFKLYGTYGASGLGTNTFWLNYAGDTYTPAGYYSLSSFAGSPGAMAMYPNVEFDAASTGVYNVKENKVITIEGNNIVLSETQQVYVYTTMGVLVYKGYTDKVTIDEAGIYIVKTASGNVKTIIR